MKYQRKPVFSCLDQAIQGERKKRKCLGHECENWILGEAVDRLCKHCRYANERLEYETQLKKSPRKGFTTAD